MHCVSSASELLRSTAFFASRQSSFLDTALKRRTPLNGITFDTAQDNLLRPYQFDSDQNCGAVNEPHYSNGKQIRRYRRTQRRSTPGLHISPQ